MASPAVRNCQRNQRHCNHQTGVVTTNSPSPTARVCRVATSVSTPNNNRSTAFTVTNSTSCLDGDGAIVGCAAATANIAVRQVVLILSGQLRGDNNVTATLRETVRIRNDEPRS